MSHGSSDMAGAVTVFFKLRALPTEIQISIMCQLDSIKSLFSLLKASSTHLQIYCQNREAIYIAVVCNYIPAKLLPIAISSLRLRDEERSADTTLLPQSFKQYTRNLVDCSVPLMPSVQEAKHLLHFHNVVNKMVNDATRRAIGLLQSRLEVQSSNTSSLQLSLQLSDFERFRVVRAFYKWEYVSLVCRHNLWARENNKVAANKFKDAFDFFFDTLPFHEVEEICFVINYLRERLGHYLNQVEKDRFEHFVANEGGSGRYQWNSDIHDVFFSEDAWPHQGHWLISVLYTQSLKTLYELFNISTSDERLARLRTIDNNYFDHTSITLRLKYHRWSRTLSDSARASFPDIEQYFQSVLAGPIDFSRCNFVETVNGPTLGLMWAYRNLRDSQPPFDLLDRLVALGLMIWDARRLRDLDFFSHDPFQIASKDSFLAWTRSGRSVEDRVGWLEDQWYIDDI